MISYNDYSKIRDSKGLKDGRVAELAGIGRSTFSDWKSGRSVPKDDKARKIAAALGVTYAYMMGWEHTPNNKSTESLEKIIDYNQSNGGSSVLANKLYNDTVKKPAALVLTDDEMSIIRKYRNADNQTKDMIVRLLSYASMMEDINNDNW